MKNVRTITALASLLAAAGLVVMGVLEQLHVDEPQTQTPAVVTAEPVPPIQERVINLPEDGGAWYSSLVVPEFSTRKNDPTARRVEAMFATNPRLVSLLAQTHFRRYWPSEPMWQSKGWAEKYGIHAGDTAYILQMPASDNGYAKVAFKLTNDFPDTGDLAADGNTLADMIQRAIDDCCPRPRPQPEPSPAPQPVPDQTPNTIPDTKPNETPPNDEQQNLVGLLVTLAALAGGGAFYKFKQTG